MPIVPPKQSPQYSSTQRNTVLAITPVELYAVSWVNGEGRMVKCMVAVFGKRADTGGPGIFVMAEESEMNEQLRLPSAEFEKGVAKHLAARREATAEEIPESIDLGSMSGPPTSATSLDLNKIDLG